MKRRAFFRLVSLVDVYNSFPFVKSMKQAQFHTPHSTLLTPLIVPVVGFGKEHIFDFHETGTAAAVIFL